MGLSRRARRLPAFLAVAAFLFAQFAVSVFACPMQGGEPKIQMTANLCQMHETSGDISADTAVPMPPALPACGARRPRGAPNRSPAPAWCGAWRSPRGRRLHSPASPSSGSDPPSVIARVPAGTRVRLHSHGGSMPYLFPARRWRDLAIALAAAATVLAAHAAPPLSFDEALRMATTHSPAARRPARIGAGGPLPRGPRLATTGPEAAGGPR